MRHALGRFLPISFASALACSGQPSGAADTEHAACLQPRCDNPNPHTCACPDDTDGIITNTPSEPTYDPDTGGDGVSTETSTGGPGTTSTTGSESTGAATTGTTGTGATTEGSSSGGGSSSDGGSSGGGSTTDTGSSGG